MEFPLLAVLALFFLALVRSDATSSPSAEDYWHSIWPHTPMPKNLQYLLESGRDNGEIKDTRYPYTSFFEDDLHPGKQMNIKFNKYSQPYGVYSWQKKQPDRVFYTMGKGPEKLTIEELCDQKGIIVGEDDRVGAESVKSLVDFAISKLGKDIQALTSSFVPHQTQYMILEGVQKVSSEGVMCHKLNFQNPVFNCHQANATITYTVPLEAADGTRTKAVALCHHDTRGLNPLMLFHELKVMPGTVPVCHFLGSEALAWVPRKDKAAC